VASKGVVASEGMVGESWEGNEEEKTPLGLLPVFYVKHVGIVGMALFLFYFYVQWRMECTACIISRVFSLLKYRDPGASQALLKT